MRKVRVAVAVRAFACLVFAPLASRGVLAILRKIAQRP
jgi:hypothetical protein